MKRALCLILTLLLTLTAFARADESALQRALAVMGFFEGKIDGVYGEKTGYAVSRLMAYLKFLGVEADEDEAKRLLLAGSVAPYAADAKPGDASENVLRVQRAFRRLGFLAYQPDGVYGDDTRRAAAAFQYANGLKVTGICDADTQRALFSDEAGEARFRALKKGDKGASVEALQRRLALTGFFTGDIDAQYGEETSLGVKAFQTYVMSSGRYGAYDRLLTASALDGAADPFLQQMLFSGDLEAPPAALSATDSGLEVYRLQRRLIMLGYLSGEPDGGYGELTAKAVAEFQRASGIKSTDCDIATLEALYSDSAAQAVKPYEIKIDLSDQRLYVYAIDESGAYSKLVSTMICSTGPDAVPGEYRAFTRPDAKLLKRESDYLRFLYRLNADLYISSIPYFDKSTFDKTRMDALGQPLTEGGIMLTLQNAKLIWEKCPARTRVEIVE